MLELDRDTHFVDALVRAGRVELWWGGSNIKFVQLRDRLTGLRASGRSYHSWNIAHEQAAHKMRRLLAEVGLEEDMQWNETKTGFYTDGKLYSMSNTWEFLRFPPLRLIDKLRLG